MSQDNLKSMFDQAFAAEQIPFDPAGWDKMNAMLNARHKRRFFGIWLSSLLLFVGGGIAVLAGFSNEATYEPRNAVNERNFIALSESLSSSENHFDITPASTEKSENTTEHSPSSNSLDPQPERKASSTPDFAASSKHDVRKSDSKEEENPMVFNDITDDDQKMTNNSSTDAMPAPSINESEPMSISSTTENTEPSVPATIEPQREMDMIDFLPILTLQTNVGQISSTDDRPEANKTKYLPALYLTAGLNKTSGNGFSFYDGIGQRAGVGGSYQWRQHIILNAELTGSRLRISDTTNIASTPTYGFVDMQNSYIINTSELIMVDLPVFVHYRMKRYYVGGGLGLTYLGGLKNETIQRVEANQSVVTSTQDEGYYQWDRYRTFGANILADLQVQLSDDLYIGTRGSYALNNALTIHSRSLQLARFDAYIKFNIK
ncbi:MAG: hypothetical protein R2813_04310 [Flavobacteriales bacterium]